MKWLSYIELLVNKLDSWTLSIDTLLSIALSGLQGKGKPEISEKSLDRGGRGYFFKGVTNLLASFVEILIHSCY